MNSIKDNFRYKPCVGDPDVLMKKFIHSDGRELNSYLVLYVDDILSIHEHPSKELEKFGSLYRLKEGSLRPPDMYLGAKFKTITLSEHDGSFTICYGNSPKNYLVEACQIVDQLMENHNLNYSSTRRHGHNTSFSNNSW